MKRFVLILGVLFLVLGVIGLVHPSFKYHQQEGGCEDRADACDGKRRKIGRYSHGGLHCSPDQRIHSGDRRAANEVDAPSKYSPFLGTE